MYLSMCITAAVFSFVSGTDPIVVTTNGPIQGTSIGNVNVFTQIPYAAPPVGSLRFQKPADPKNWTSTLMCNSGQYSHACLQNDPNYNTSEDCLYLNVFTPNMNGKLPVMVWIHGGAYVAGATTDYPIDGIVNNLAARGVVVVSLNYRLNAFGFFTTHTNEIPANLAMFDQLKGLQWVRDNIVHFGGDPEQVTIFGESAGASSVSLHTYSPLSKGLYHRAIMQSGVAYSAFALNGMRENYDPSMDYAISLGCTSKEQWLAQNFTGLRDCLAAKTTSALLTAAFNTPPSAIDHSQDWWVPSVDGPGGFMPDVPDKLAHNRLAISVLLGSNKDELSGPELECLLANACQMANFTEQTYQFVQANTLSSIIFGEATQDIHSLFSILYGGRGMDHIGPTDYERWLNHTVQMQSDYVWSYPVWKETQNWLAVNATTYLYSFDYASASLPWTSTYAAVPHAMDLAFVFNMTAINVHDDVYLPFNKNENDTFIIDLFGTMWTNFAKTGDPNLPNPPSSSAGQWLPTDQHARYFTFGDPDATGMRPAYHPMAVFAWGKAIPDIVAAHAVPSTTTTSAITKMPTSAATEAPEPTKSSASRSYNIFVLFGTGLMVLLYTR